jgi:hypothetical protein
VSALAPATIDRGRIKLGESPVGRGLVAPSTRDLRVEERGVTFPLPMLSFTGVSFSCACNLGRGLVAASTPVRTVAGRLSEPAPADVVVVAKRGVKGALGVRVAASVGLSVWACAGGLSEAMCSDLLSRRYGRQHRMSEIS